MLSIVAKATRIALKLQRKVHGATGIDFAWPDGHTVHLSYAKQGGTNWNADGPFDFSRVGDKSIDWLVNAAELVGVDGQFRPPERDCQIRMLDEAGHIQIYRCLTKTDAGQYWQPVDREGQSEARIFTKYHGRA